MHRFLTYLSLFLIIVRDMCAVLGVLSLKIHIGVFGMINKWKYSILQTSPLISWLPWQQRA